MIPVTEIGKGIAMLAAENGEVFRLSLNQLNIWNLEQLYGGSSINNISTTLKIRGRLDFTLLQQAIDHVLSLDPTLRTRLVMKDGEPWQYSAPYVQELFPVYDFSGTEASGVEVWEQTLAREALPLLESPLYRFILFRTGEHTGGVYVKLHHIISDGWSQALICNRIADAYFKLLSGEEPEFEEIPGYRLHVEEEQQYLESRHYSRDKRYWQTVMAGENEPSALKDMKGAAVSPVGRRYSCRLPQHLNHAIYTYCMRKRIAPFSVFYTALATYFRRIGGGDRFTIGVPIFNRTNYQFRRSTGMFVSTLPFVGHVDADMNFEEFTDDLAENWLDMLRHQRFPFKDICAMGDGPEERLFQIALSYQDSKLYESHDTSVAFSGRWHYSGYQAEQLCIHLSNLENIREYAVDYDYLAQFFTEKEIITFHNCLMNILTEGLAHLDRPLRELSMLDPAQREQVLYTFNRTARYLRPETAYGALSRTVEGHPERVALICRGERLTYAALRQRAEGIAAAVSRTKPGEKGVAAILLPRNFELFMAMIGVLRAGWAYLLISEETPALRAMTILEQSGADLLVSSRETMDKFRQMGLGIPLVTMEDGDTPVPEAEMTSAGPEDLAYIVYTSGSTGTPKGVEVCQHSLLNLADAMKPIYGNGAVLSMCNTGFDAFVLESAAALLDGRTVVLPTQEELESPRRLAALIRNFAVGSLITTPSRLQALLQDCEFRRAMNRIECVVCGGEAFPRELMLLLSACSRARIYNQYGPSETTVAVSHKLLNTADLITVGMPMQNCHLYVLDRWRNPVPVGVYGELYIGGLCVARGYRNDPELTAEKFLPSPFESNEKIYRTGDIACWTEEGEIVLAGRSDHQVKLHGLRVEPQEIISVLSGYPGVEHVAVQVVEAFGQPVIAAYFTSSVPISDVELLTYAASYLPRYMVPACLQRVAEIPLTPNGKVDLGRLPAPNFGTPCSSLPADDRTKQVLTVFCRNLQQELGPDDDYFLRGGSSLTAMQTLAELEEQTSCTMRVSDLYACRTARRLAQCISQRLGSEPSVSHAIDKAPQQESYPLSPIQRGMYFQCAMDRYSVIYNMPGAFRISNSIDPEQLEQAFRRLIQDEPGLRTAFLMEDGNIRAKVRNSVNFELEHLRGNTAEEVFREFLRPFDLEDPPLIRAGLWENGEEIYLFVDTHHMISDGLTTPILMDRLDSYYRGENPALPGVSYIDYACYLEKQGGASEEDRAYWKEYLEPMPEPLQIPDDIAKKDQLTGKGAKLTHRLSAELSTRVTEFCRGNGLSEFSFFMAGFGLLIGGITRRETFTVGSPVSSRNRPELMEVCGPLLGVLPVKVTIDPAMMVGDYLQLVARGVAGMLDHSGCSQEDLIRELKLPHIPDGNPLYSVTLSLRPFDVHTLTLGGKPMELLPLSSETNKADMGLEVAKDGDIYELNFEYAADYFAIETIAFYGRCMAAILEGLMDPGMGNLGELDLMDPADRFKMFDERDHLYKPFLNIPVHEIARRTAMFHGSDIAVVFHGRSYTRMEIERRACQFANGLIGRGVTPRGRVGICMSRTPDLFAAMLGILKTGCAYVPMLPSFPEKRLQYMADTAGISVILTDKATEPGLPEGIRNKTMILPDGCPETFAPVQVGQDDLINVLFTSGSTGQPKGVMVRHGAASNLLSNMEEALQGVTGPMLCVTTISFDIFMTESLLPLAMGRTIILADEEEMLLPWRIAELIQRNKAGFIQFTASRLSMCLSSDAFCKAAENLQYTIVGGEQVSVELVRKFKSCCSGRLVNHYGPTEATVYTTCIDLSNDQDVTIGRPMGNCRVYLLDEKGGRLLPTSQGELYLAGTCVAAGYLGRPDLTEKAFLPDPFVPGEMMYRSGDLGRLRVDGRIDYLGRLDKQVKINGQRLEIDEIVNVMMDSKLLTQGVVVPVTRENGAVSLHAFCVRQDRNLHNYRDLAEYMREYLPGYMIPAVFHLLEDLPYTAGGKADLVTLQRMAEESDDRPDTVPEVPLIDKTQVPMSAPMEESSAELLAPEENAVQAVRENTHVSEKTSRNSGKNQEKMEILQNSGVVTEELLLSVWNQVLKTKNLQADVSFFDQGGTSLDTLNVLSLYFNMGLNMGVSQFYQNPTARAQTAIFNKGRPVPSIKTAAPVMAESTQVTQLQPEHVKALPKQVPEKEVKLQPQQEPAPAKSLENALPNMEISTKIQYSMSRRVPGSKAGKSIGKVVFLTGGTGFFGAHLLRELLRSGTEEVICLVRGEEKRLWENLSWYFGQGWTASARRKLRVVSGDLRQPRMGLSEEAYRALAGKIQSVFHAAADVRHFVRDEEKLIYNNLSATEEAIRLALAADAPLHLMSTLSVSGEYLKDHPEKPIVFTERDFDMGQNWENNVYVRSKMLSEAAVYDAMAKHGLRAGVYRLGRLVWRAEDAVFQKNPGDNMTVLLCSAIASLGACPDEFAHQLMDMTPVDVAARMVVALSGSPLTTLHICNPDPAEAWEFFREGMLDVRLVPEKEFMDLLGTRMAAEPGGPWALLAEFVRMQKQVRITAMNLMTQAAMDAVDFDPGFPNAEEIGRGLFAVLAGLKDEDGGIKKNDI